MESIFKDMFGSDLFEKPYDSYEEYMSDIYNQAELLIIYYLRCVGFDENVDYESIEKLKQEENSKISENIKKYSSFAKDEFSKAAFLIKSRLKESIKKKKNFFAFEYIRSTYSLTDLESFLLVLSMIECSDNKYTKIFKALYNDPEKSLTDYDLAIKLYFFVYDISEIQSGYDIKLDLMSKFSTLIFRPYTQELDQRLFSFIESNGRSKIDLRGVQCLTGDENKPLLVMEDIPERMVSVAYENKKGETIFYYLNGPEGIGKRTIAKRFASILDTSLILIDVMQLDITDQKIFYEVLITACREAIINQGVLCFFNFDYFMSEENENYQYINLIMSTARQYSALVVILSKDPIKKRNMFNDYMWLDIRVPLPNKDESIKLWQRCLSDVSLDEKIEPYEMANKFTFTPGQIIGTAIESKKLKLWKQSQTISKKEFYDCAYAQIVHDLEKKATLIYARYNWDQLILDKEQKDMLKNACDQVRFKHIVYDKWGFEKRLAYGRGVSMLFAGPPGTGKTMAAQVVANDLGIEIYKVDLSQIVSKYIGETEKNLNDLFNEAKKSNVILFFDETDALLGKRTEVKDSHDKNSNLETSYLLQKMEEYDGITVMSTNYLENIDQAFFRRISYVIHFPFPDVESRKKIWENMYPENVPLEEDVDFDYLANQFEIAGGNIKNIAVVSAFLAAKENSKVGMKHIIKAIKYELTKQGKTVLREDFGEHGYLLNT